MKYFNTGCLRQFVRRTKCSIGGAATLLIALTFSGCDDFVDVSLPPTQLTSQSVYEDKATANAAMAEIYYQLRSNGLLAGNSSGLSVQMGAYADELTYYGDDSIETSDFYANGILATSAEVRSWWNTAYNQVYQANAVLEGVSRSVSLEEPVKRQLRGEALFIRGLIHLYLVNLIGDIPYITTTDYTVNSTVSRNPTSDVYARIIADLEEAVTLLPAEYQGEGRVKPNKFAAYALLARTYLYNGNWAEASNAASAVLNEASAYALGTDIGATFLKESPSAIWQLMTPGGGQNTDEAASFIFTEAPPYFVSLSAGFIASFEPGDLRLANWTGNVTDGSETYYYANKYKETAFTGSSVEYPVVLRLSEQYLIRAEARARQGDIIGATEDLDVIRAFAGLPGTTASTATGLVDAILQERRVEFFTEYGHRFFDLKRMNRLDDTLSGTKPGWNTSDRLLPVPDAELTINPNLNPQNTGY